MFLNKPIKNEPITPPLELSVDKANIGVSGEIALVADNAELSTTPVEEVIVSYDSEKDDLELNEEYSEESDEYFETDVIEEENNIPQDQSEVSLAPTVNNPSEEKEEEITIVECDPNEGVYRFYDKDGNLIGIEKIDNFTPIYPVYH